MTNLDDAGPSGSASSVFSPSRRTRRQVYERQQRIKSSVIAALSTIAVVTLLVVWIPTLDGWPSVRKSFFDGETFRKSFGPILRAFWLDVRIFLACSVLIVITGLLVALARSVRSPLLYPLRLFATLYTDLVRGVPVILWIFIIGFGVAGLSRTRDVGVGPLRISTLLLLGCVALVFTYSAYVAEVFRGGIEGVHENQRAAARALGLSTAQTNRTVVLPQAVRKMAPPLVNDLVSLQKDVSLVSFLGPVEALRRADVLQDSLFNFTPFVVAALMFMTLSIPLTRIGDTLTRRERLRTSGTVVR